MQEKILSELIQGERKGMRIPLNPGCLMTGSLFHGLSLRIQDYPEIS